MKPDIFPLHTLNLLGIKQSATETVGTLTSANIFS